LPREIPEKITEQPPIPEPINLSLGSIAGGGRLGLRQVDKRKLSKLIESIKEVGLINPITVVKRQNPHGSEPYVVLCGHNRFMACEAIGLDPVPCRCVGEHDVKNADFKIMQADENLVRIDLTNDDLETHLAHRKFWYEVKHPETKHGGAPGKRVKGSKGGKVAPRATLPPSFAADTAAATGMAERTIRQYTERGEKIDREVSASLTGTPLDTRDYRDELKNVPKQQQAAKVTADLVSSGGKKKEVNRLIRIGAPAKEIAEMTGGSEHTIRRDIEKYKLKKKTLDEGRAEALEELADFDRFESFFKTVITGFSHDQREKLRSILVQEEPKP
jgi:DNA-binding CsgD family transcriptional regulator